MRISSKIFNTIIALVGISFSVQPVFSNEFCNNLDDYAKNKESTADHEAEIAQFATPLYANKAADCEIIKKYKQADWALIDARDKASRKATGSFDGAVFIESNHKDDSKDKFNEKYLLKSLGKHFGNKKITLDELKEKELVLFCNGFKCYRSSWGACSLSKLGFKKEKVRVVLDGQAGLKENCLK